MQKIFSTTILFSFIFIFFLSCSSRSVVLDSNIVLDFESKSYTDSTVAACDGELVKSTFFSGESCLSLPEKKQRLKLEVSLKSKNIYKISCWKQGDVRIKSNLKHNGENVDLKEKLSYIKKKGWEKIELIINTAWWDTTAYAVVVFENIGSGQAFVDDVVVEKIKGDKPDYSFEIKNKDIERLLAFRNNAFHSPYIKAKNKQKIKAELNDKPVKFKLKGDWTDHITSGIWSFKTYGEEPITGDSKTLTFQNVKTRNLLKEWVFINLCKTAGIITPNYEIVTVSVNNGTPYVCALEENFSDNFIQRKRGYSAPVLRLYEDFLFPHWVYGWGNKNVVLPEINHSYIYCFDTKKYSEEGFKNKFNEHAEKLRQFIKNDSILHLIDQEKWAEFLAIQALTKSYHNLTWHNTRWFVNDKGLIEPVAYDGNTQNGEAEHWFGGLYGDLNRYMKTGSTVAINFNNKLFMSEEFMKLYKSKLELYSNEDFLKEKLSLFSDKMEKSLKKIQLYYDYVYTTDYLFVSANKLKKELKNIDNSNWIGKEHIFNVDFKVGDAPLNKLYAENLIRGYINGKKLRIVNGTSEEVSFFDTEKQNAFTIGPNDEITIDYSKDAKWFFEVESKKLKLEMVAWMPLK
ncbi:MAG: hypothetical protein CMD35_04785 [Flavobacteriales bacterium]|nr:hypothetical protein [Flavobacteriales bacterium]